MHTLPKTKIENNYSSNSSKIQVIFQNSVHNHFVSNRGDHRGETPALKSSRFFLISVYKIVCVLLAGIKWRDLNEEISALWKECHGGTLWFVTGQTGLPTKRLYKHHLPPLFFSFAPLSAYLI